MIQTLVMFVLLVLYAALLSALLAVIWYAGRRALLSRSSNVAIYLGTVVLGLVVLREIGPYLIVGATPPPVLIWLATAVPIFWVIVLHYCHGSDYHAGFDKDAALAPPRSPDRADDVQRAVTPADSGEKPTVVATNSLLSFLPD